jgi:polyhydroxyalkanoate synthesis regulator phasin
MMDEEDIVKKVFLLAILTRESGDTLEEVTKVLVNTGMFDLQEGRRILQELKNDEYIVGDELSFKGIAIAQAAQEEFRLH